MPGFLNFKRKTKDGNTEEQEVSQEEFDALVEQGATLEEIMNLFPEESQEEGFEITERISDLLEMESQLRDLFEGDIEAEDFDLSARIQELQANSGQLIQIEELVQDNDGETTLDKVKSITPESRTQTPKEGAEGDSSLESGKKFQDYEHNQAMIKQLRKAGVTLASVDYKQLN